MNTNNNINYTNNYNGRIDIMGPNIDQFQLFDNPNNNYKNITSYKDALNGNWTTSLLSKAFFSKENIIILQNGIRAGVYRATGGLYSIGPQDETTLKVIMRSIYLQYSINNPNNITQQISELNNLVYEYSIPKIVSEATAYIKYKQDVSTLAMPEDRPAYVNSKGDKQLELKKWF